MVSIEKVVKNIDSSDLTIEKMKIPKRPVLTKVKVEKEGWFMKSIVKYGGLSIFKDATLRKYRLKFSESTRAPMLSLTLGNADIFKSKVSLIAFDIPADVIVELPVSLVNHILKEGYDEVFMVREGQSIGESLDERFEISREEFRDRHYTKQFSFKEMVYA